MTFYSLSGPFQVLLRKALIDVSCEEMAWWAVRDSNHTANPFIKNQIADELLKCYKKYTLKYTQNYSLLM